MSPVCAAGVRAPDTALGRLLVTGVVLTALAVTVPLVVAGGAAVELAVQLHRAARTVVTR